MQGCLDAILGFLLQIYSCAKGLFGKNRYALFAKWMGRLAIFAKTRFAKSSNYLLGALLVQRLRKTAHPFYTVF